MELLSIEDTKVYYLVQIYRAAGQPYGPDLAATFVQRYSFVQYPAPADLLRAVDAFVFSMGRFKNVGIQEMRIYSDGLSVTSKSSTKIIDEFIDDVFAWLEKEWGTVRTSLPKHERHYESRLIIKSESDLTRLMEPKSQIVTALNKAWAQSSNLGTSFGPVGFIADCAPGKSALRRKPVHFALERRVGFDPGDNVFYSLSPLSTDDHLGLLGELERLAPR